MEMPSKQLAAMFPLSESEQARLAKAPFPNIAAHWLAFAQHLPKHLLLDYAHGEIEMNEMLQIMWDCSVGCEVGHRISLLGYTAARALQITKRKHLNRKKPPYPLGMKNSAVNLLLHLKEANPDMPLGPNASTRKDSVLSLTLRWLKTIRLFGTRRPPAEKTLYRWYREHENTVQASGGAA